MVPNQFNDDFKCRCTVGEGKYLRRPLLAPSHIYHTRASKESNVDKSICSTS